VNVFRYVQNDPVNWVDPDGLDPVSATIGIGAGASSSGVGAAIAVGAAQGVAVVGVGVGTYAATSWVLDNFFPSLANGGLGEDLYDLLHPPVAMAKGGKEKGANWATELVKMIAQESNRSPCEILKEMYDNECDNSKKQAIKAAQKFLGCRRSSGRK